MFALIFSQWQKSDGRQNGYQYVELSAQDYLQYCEMLEVEPILQTATAA
jgi:hypothetical protein